MDLEVVGFDGLLGSETTAPAYLTSSSSSLYASDSEAKKRLHGSGFLSPVSKATLLRSIGNGNYLSENGQQHMLSFSPSNAQSSVPLSSYYNDLYHQASAISYAAAAAGGGGGGGDVNGATVNRMTTTMMMRGPFTQSQWMELENQALIYKYINANAPVPSNLLIPILKASDFASFPPFSVGWGPFHLGFSNSTDPEPGRCRRTDGKKWRCSRDSVPDHKYCERHMNRGRHRSRKPVEVKTGRSVVSSSASKLVQAASAAATAATAASDGLSLSQPGGSIASPCSTNGNNRVFLNAEKVKTGGGKVHDSGLKPTQFIDNSEAKFGLLLGVDSFLNNGSSYNNHIDERGEYMIKNKHNNWFPGSWFDSNNHNHHHHHHHHHERTELSISIPMMSDFIPSMNEDHFPSTEMGLGLGDQKQQQSSWIPVEWGISNNNCMGGGPLGEVVSNKMNMTRNDETAAGCKKLLSSSSSSGAYALDLMSSSSNTTNSHNWDNSPRGFGSSPTGVLHNKVHFGSVSNSSAGSSPRTESHIG